METSAGIRDGVFARCTEYNQERQKKELIPHGLERLIKPEFMFRHIGPVGI